MRDVKMTSYKDTLKFYKHNIMDRVESLYWKLKEGTRDEQLKAFNELSQSVGTSRKFEVSQ